MTLSARALATLFALACLLCSDGVGPRLIPYPATPAGQPRASQPKQPQVHTNRNSQRERALIALGVKLNSLKQDKFGQTPNFIDLEQATVGGRAKERALVPSEDAGGPAPSFRYMSSAPRRGPPTLS